MKTRRIIFVGMNNKPGIAPLCSSTKSGKLIDRIIDELSPLECIKSNLWDLDYWPKHDKTFNQEWIDSVQYDFNDVVVTLGECVRKSFLKSGIKYTHIGHPSAVWSKEKQSEYILNALIRIEKFATN